MMLITVAMANDQPLPVLDYLAALLRQLRDARLAAAVAPPPLALLTSEVPAQANELTAEFVVRNEHGLHARPGTSLVSIMKQFDSAVTVTISMAAASLLMSAV